MRSLAAEMFQRVAPIYAKFEDVDGEIHDLFAEIFSKRKLGKKSHTQVEEIYLNMQLIGLISPRTLETEADEEWDEFEAGAAPEDSFAAAGEEDASSRDRAPEERPAHAGREAAEGRNMRQTFLRLASVFHPDRAGDGDERAQNAEIMKEINRAYADGDFARLIELERQHDRGELETVTAENPDDLERQCQRLERQNAALSEQYEGIKAELRTLRNDTYEGEMVTTYRQAKREGYDFFEEVIAAAERDFAELENVRDFVRDFRDRKITIKEFLRGPGWAEAAEYVDELIAAGVPPELAANMPPDMAQMIIASGVRVNVMPDLF